MAAIFVWTLDSVMLVAVIVGIVLLMLFAFVVDLYDRTFKRR